jgi:serine protease Do
MARGAAGITAGFLVLAGSLVGLVAGGRGSVRAPGFGAAPPSFADIVERANPSVVQIMVVDRAGYVPEDEEEGEELDPGLPRRGDGTGFVVDAEGYILTNQHLVAAPARIRVRFADKREAPATLVGSDASTDLALLKVEAHGLRPLPLGDSDAVRVGDWVCAIGNPLSFDHSVTVGVVSSKGRKIWDTSFDAYLQTDAAINPGNSGGPLLSGSGEVVGVNAAMSVEGEGIGFAIPINIAREILDQLRTAGHVTRGYLGVELQELEPDLSRMLGLGEARGAMVLDVRAGGPGEQAGLERWDVITGIEGRPVADGDQLVRLVSARPPGTPVELSVIRDGRPLVLTARLERREAGEERAESVAEPASAGGDGLGLVVGELSRKARRRLKLPEERSGVVVHEVRSAAPGLDAVASGDLVVEVNRQPTPDVAAYRRALGALQPGAVAWLYVYRPRPPGSFLAKVEVER